MDVYFYTRMLMMRTKTLLLIIFVLFSLCLFPNIAQEPATVVLIDGLNSPRGISYDANGVLYVVESGVGGDLSVPGPFDGSVLLGFSGRISVLSNENLIPVVEYLPSAQVESAPGAPIEVLGAMDVELVDDELWFLTGHIMPDIYQTAMAIGLDFATRRAKYTLDFYAYELENETDRTGEYLSNPTDIEFFPESKIALIADTGANVIFRKGEDGSFNVLHVWEDNPVPTGIDISDEGSTYAIGFLSTYPFTVGTARVELYNAGNNELLVSYGNLTTVTDVLIEPNGTILAVQYAIFDIDLGGWQPNTGSLVAIAPDGTQTTLLSNLNFPYSITKNPVDGSYAISVNVVGDFGTGQVLGFSLATPTS
jgi:hypothetical protein